MVIEVDKVTKEFRTDFWKKKKRVLDGVSFGVDEGLIYGFLGPNGAGKTTTIKILMGLIFPDSGKAKIFGDDVKKISFKKDLGYMPESPYFYDHLKACEMLHFYGSLFGLSGKLLSTRIGFLLEEVGLKGDRDVQLRKFSKGMLQRIGLAQAMINDPRLLVLDEPMSGLDPIGRKQVRDIIMKNKQQGKTIFFSSHILSDVEMICDKVSIIVAGKIVDSGYIKDLLNPKILFYEIEIDQNHKKSLGGALLEGLEVSDRGKSSFIKIPTEEALRKMDTRLLEKGIGVISVNPVKETLEQLFVKHVEMMGR